MYLLIHLSNFIILQVRIPKEFEDRFLIKKIDKKFLSNINKYYFLGGACSNDFYK